MEEWKCPWCGEEWVTGKPDSERSIVAWDMWLEGHVLDCEPAKVELGIGDDDYAI